MDCSRLISDRAPSCRNHRWISILHHYLGFYAQVAKKLSTTDNDRNDKHGLGQSLFLGLDILVAADVIGPQPALADLGGGA
jgi:Protein of unknown function (DUF1622)